MKNSKSHEKLPILREFNFWFAKFMHYKLTTLSNKAVVESEIIFKCLVELKKQNLDLTEIYKIVKMARNAGMIGIQTYYTPLFKLADFVLKLDISNFYDINDEFLIDFLALQNKSIQTRKNYRTVLLNFFEYINKNMDHVPNARFFRIELNISRIKGKKAKLPAYLNELEIKRFLNAMSEIRLPPNTRSRDLLIITLIIYTGIRVSEALNLQSNDIWRESHEELDVFLLKVHGKGDKSRIVMIKASYIDELLNSWLLSRVEFVSKNLNNGKFLFCNKNSKPLSQPYIYGVIQKILLFAGIKKEKMGPHMLRHSFATLLYNQHKDLILVQEALGHANLNTSRIYTHFDKDSLFKTTKILDHLRED